MPTACVHIPTFTLHIHLVVVFCVQVRMTIAMCLSTLLEGTKPLLSAADDRYVFGWANTCTHMHIQYVLSEGAQCKLYNDTFM